MKNHNGDLVKRFGKYSIIKCKTCKFIHANPIPTNKELFSLYTNDFYKKIKPDYIHGNEKEIEYLLEGLKDFPQEFDEKILNLQIVLHNA